MDLTSIVPNYAVYNKTEVLVDPINWVIKLIGTTVHCSNVAPPRFLILNAWYCQYKGLLMECHKPTLLPSAHHSVGYWGAHAQAGAGQVHLH